jgi:hypothetical protein
MKSATITLGILLASCATFLLTPYVPGPVLKLLVENYVGSAALLITVLYVLRMDVVLGLAVFLAVAALFLESRRRIVVHAVEARESRAPVEVLDKPAPDIVPGEVHPSFQDPAVKSNGFEPQDDSGSNDFDRVGESINEKDPPLDTVPPRSEDASALFQNKGLASPFEASNSA